MPIRPERAGLYPPNWKEIREQILERAEFRCEGTPAYPDCNVANYELHPITGSKVVLTIAHLTHDERESDPTLLKAMCQRCHNTYDVQHRREGIKQRKRENAAVRDLFDGGLRRDARP